MAECGYQTSVTTSPSVIFQSSRDGGSDGQRPFEVFLENDASSGSVLYVLIDPIHKTDYCPLAAGTRIKFWTSNRAGEGIRTITVKTLTGTAKVNFGITGR